MLANLKKAHSAGPATFAAVSAAVTANPQNAVALETGGRMPLLKWIARERAEDALRWIHGVAPLSRGEIEGAGLISAFVRACNHPALEWLHAVCPVAEFKLTLSTLKCLIKHDGPASLATAEWISAHHELSRRQLYYAVYWAILAGKMPIARHFLTEDNRLEDYAEEVWQSGSLDILRWFVETVENPVPLLFPGRFYESVGKTTPAMVEYFIAEFGEERFAPRMRPSLVYSAIAYGNLELAEFLRVTFPREITEEAIRASEDYSQLIERQLMNSDPVPTLQWLERVCPPRPGDLSQTITLAAVQGNKSLEDFQWCLEHFGTDIRETHDLVSCALGTRRHVFGDRMTSAEKAAALRQTRWLLATHGATPEAMWTPELFRIIDKYPDPIQLTQELHAVVKATRELVLAALPAICATVNIGLLRWVCAEFGFTLNEFRAAFAALDEFNYSSLLRPVSVTHRFWGKPEAAVCAYIEFLGELGELTVADWATNNYLMLLGYISCGHADLVALARRHGVDAEHIRPHFPIMPQRPHFIRPCTQILSNTFGFSCREIRCGAMNQCLNQEQVLYLRDEFGLCAEDIREHDHNILRNAVARHHRIKIKTLFSCGIGLNREDAVAVMDLVENRPNGGGQHNINLWQRTRCLLRKLAEGGAGAPP